MIAKKIIMIVKRGGIKIVINTRTKASVDNWETPPAIFNLLNKEFKFTVDIAASHKNPLCKKYYTEKENGLLQDLSGETAYCNPPYDNKDPWIKKCYKEGQKEHTLVVMLIPNGTETIGFHEYCMKAYEIRLVKARIDFYINGIEFKGNNRGSIIVIFKKHNNKFPRLRPFYHKEKDLIQYKDILEFNQKISEPVECKDCSYNYFKDCSDGCLKKRYYEEEEGLI